MDAKGVPNFDWFLMDLVSTLLANFPLFHLFLLVD
jgi:hypothetical protein